MIGFRRRYFHNGVASVSVCAVAVACAFVLVGAAQGEDARPAADVPPASVQPPPSPPSQQGGFIDTLGRWLDEGADRFKSNMQNAQETLDKLGNQARESTRDATAAVVGLPNARVVEAREPCVAAQNGAPDCQAAAVTLCRGQGFASGKSLDTRTEQKCKSGRFLLEGRAPTSSDCPAQIFVTRAMCQ